MDHAGNARDLAAAEIKVEYRCCALLKNHIALSAVFKCKKATREEVEQRMGTFSSKRWDSQNQRRRVRGVVSEPGGDSGGKLDAGTRIEGHEDRRRDGVV